jgi:thiol-disulfide isomerase/thioredoxin
MRKIGLLSLLLLMLVISAGAKNARKLSLKDLNGEKTRVADLKGLVVVINLWATWCTPCKEELPRLEQVAESYSGKPVSFVLISIDEKKKLDVVKRFVEEHHMRLPVWVGGSTDLLEDLSGTVVLPATLVLDQDGEIVRVVNGVVKDEDITEAVDWLLNGKQGEPPSKKVKRY